MRVKQIYLMGLTSIVLGGCQNILPLLKDFQIPTSLPSNFPTSIPTISPPTVAPITPSNVKSFNKINPLHVEMLKLQEQMTELFIKNAGPIMVGIKNLAPTRPGGLVAFDGNSFQNHSSFFPSPAFKHAGFTLKQERDVRKEIPRGTYPVYFTDNSTYHFNGDKVKANEPADRTHVFYTGGGLDSYHEEFKDVYIGPSSSGGERYALLSGGKESSNPNTGISLWGNPPRLTERLKEIEGTLLQSPESIALLKQFSPKVQASKDSLLQKYRLPTQERERVLETGRLAKQLSEDLKNEQLLKSEEITQNLQEVKTYLADKQPLPEALKLLFTPEFKSYASVGLGTEAQPTKINYEMTVLNPVKLGESVSLEVFMRRIGVDYAADPDVDPYTTLVSELKLDCQKLVVRTSGKVVLAFPRVFESEAAVKEAIATLNTMWGSDTPFDYTFVDNEKAKITYSFFVDVTQTIQAIDLVHIGFARLISLTGEQKIDKLLNCDTATPSPAPSASPNPPASGIDLNEFSSYLKQMQETRDYIRVLVDQAQQKRDIIKTNCLTDKLNQVDVAKKSATDHFDLLQVAIKDNNAKQIDFEAGEIRKSKQRVDTLKLESQLCVGEDIE